MEHWTEGLVNAAVDIDRELAQLGADYLGYSSDENLHPSAKLTLFFKGVAPALAQLRERVPTQLAKEVRRLCMGTMERVLTKIVYRNPGINLENVLRTLPPEADLEALKAQVAHIVAKAGKIKRVDRDRVD